MFMVLLFKTLSLISREPGARDVTAGEKKYKLIPPLSTVKQI